MPPYILESMYPRTTGGPDANSPTRPYPSNHFVGHACIHRGQDDAAGYRSRSAINNDCQNDFESTVCRVHPRVQTATIKPNSPVTSGRPVRHRPCAISRGRFFMCATYIDICRFGSSMEVDVRQSCSSRRDPKLCGVFCTEGGVCVSSQHIDGIELGDAEARVRPRSACCLRGG